ncbi:hypothetical protein AJ80_04154 [Polytolypa hystricis UAMH7299]|uniref:Uncharacterized protein n=1 Tax=Polytolypa hystricis (strain UAMH7299) TaxID=1447883 RepID=A0A2B7Y4W6_POLH7|nr:hypothetical protein AJ80_04154 [Polytolypa hystricis UAMH7299]
MDESEEHSDKGGQPSSYPDLPVNPRSFGIGDFPQTRNTLQRTGFGEPERSASEEPSDDEDYGGTPRSKRRRLFDDAEISTEDEYQPSDRSLSSEAEMEDDDRARSSYGRRGRKSSMSDNYDVRGGKGIKRGPRKPLEPSAEFKSLHSAATSAFIDSDYDRAIVLVKQAIQINPEMFAAHSLLSEIFLAQGHKDKALAALFSGAHTRPKDPTVWMNVAELILDRAGNDKASALQDVVYCYSRAIEIDQTNYKVRFQRAAIYRELGYNGKAAQEYERLLKDLPHNTIALRQLAEIYIDLNDVERARNHYDNSISYYTSLGLEEAADFTWSDVNIYVELFSYLNDFAQGISVLKSLARWLLGRKDDVQWDTIREDDREWDVDDYPRRVDMPWFIQGQYPVDTYGQGLPLELRMKLGVYRLKLGVKYRDEALSHFAWLDPENNAPNAPLFDYGDLFRDAADALKDAGLHLDALRFYTPLQQTNEYADTSLFMSMAECHAACQNDEEAENCYLTVVEYDEENIEVRAKLAQFYEKLGMTEQALTYVNEALELGRQEFMPRRKRRLGSRIEQLVKEFRALETEGDTTLDHAAPDEGGMSPPGEDEQIATRSAPMALTGYTPASTQRERRRGAQERAAIRSHIQYLFSKMLELQPLMRSGDEDATEDWLDIADALIRDFRSNRVFFPLQRRMTFLGYSREAQRKAGRLKAKTIMDDVEEMANRLQAALGTQPLDNIDPDTIPTDYHNISFESWLDVFLEYSLVLAGQNQSDEAYDTLAAAADASIWYHSKPSMRQIYVCWFSCAIRVKDEETLSNIARWFMKEYQFVTDTYRLFAALSRLCGDPDKSLFQSSPSMKFMLRQIKAIDYTLPDDSSKSGPVYRTRASIYNERAALTTRDESGQPIPAEDMDVALLVLYGHILYAGSSFTNALNYFFRAYALDPENPAVLLSIGLSYIHHSLKRQSDNRHYLIMQGLSFMQEYRRVRGKSAIPQERQEVEFNFARVWHMLGLSHLAVQGYQKCLNISQEIEQERQRRNRLAEKQRAHDDVDGETLQQKEGFAEEDFSREAAFALQCLYSISGETEMAKNITERWLVV